MNAPAPHLSPSEASARLGISIKALRHYEERNLLRPLRSAAGWRVYGPEQMAAARTIVALRGLGLSVRQIGRILEGEHAAAIAALDAHRRTLERDLDRTSGALARINAVADRLEHGEIDTAAAIAAITDSTPTLSVVLPWPWGGETFAWPRATPLTYVVGALGSGKTRLVRHLADALGVPFIGLDRPDHGTIPPPASAARDALIWLANEGATMSMSLERLMVALTSGADAYVIDYVEAGLDGATQTALGSWLLQRDRTAPPIVLTTRSTAILDLGAINFSQTLVFCPANHAPPQIVVGRPGAPGFEALESCLATPDVRARTEGMRATCRRQLPAPERKGGSDARSCPR